MNKRIFLSLVLVLGRCTQMFCCSILSWSSEGTHYLGTNEAWFSSPSYVMRFSPSVNGLHGFVSFLHEGEDTIQGGMNDAGLSFDWVAGYENNWKERQHRITIEEQLSQYILKQASTVEEALDILTSYNDPSFGIARMLLADASGNSAIIGWNDGDVRAVTTKNSFQSLGFAEEIIEHDLTMLKKPSMESFIGILHRTAQRGTSLRTSYSAVYDLGQKSFSLIDTLGTGERYSFVLSEELKKGERTLRLKDLFTGDTSEQKERTKSITKDHHRWPDRASLTIKVGAGLFSIPSYNKDDKNVLFPLPLISLEYEREGLTAFLNLLEGSGLRYQHELTGLFLEGSCGFGEMKDKSGANGESIRVNAPVRLNVKAGYGFDILTVCAKAELLPTRIEGNPNTVSYCGRYGASAGLVVGIGSFIFTPEVSLYLMNASMADVWYSAEGQHRFNASPGLEKLSSSFSARYTINYHLSLNALVLTDLFLSDAHKSPEVASYQTSAGMYVLYRL